LDVTEVGGVLIVDGNQKAMYVRRSRNAGAYRDTDTAFYVNAAGQFSLGSHLYWNPEDNSLTVDGTIYAESGNIGGWDISPTTLSKNNAVLDSAGQLALGTGNDIIILSATDATYRMWIGNATAGTAAFSVTKAGALYSVSGTIGGFTIGTDYLRDAGNTFGMASTVTGGDDVRFWAGESFANRASAPFWVKESGEIYASSGTIGGFTITSTKLSAGSGINYVEMNPTASIGLIVGNVSAAFITMRILAGTAPTLAMTDSTGADAAALQLVSGAGSLTLFLTGAPTIQLDGSTGDITASDFIGGGAGLTGLNASNIASGTLSNNRLPSAISVTSVTASGEIRGATARFGTHSALGTEVLSGFITHTDAGGTTRKLAVIS
jgi:hypothetical protein